MDNPVVLAIVVVAVAAIGLIAGFLARGLWAAQAVKAAQEKATRIVAEARAQQKELILEAKDEKLRLQREVEVEARSRRTELTDLERRLLARDEQLDQRTDMLEQRDRKLLEKERELERARDELARAREQQVAALERVAGMSVADAKAALTEAIREEAELDGLRLSRAIERRAREEADDRAREIISTAMQRVAADHTAEHTVSAVHLPNEEMKGRIIGREGRNIRALEMATGVDIIVDDTPEAVILSSFDPVRRELARLSIQKLVTDGRIHPARIEDIVESVKNDLEQKIKQEGESAVLELKVRDIHPELIKLLGKLKYRTSYGQNVLQHSKEVAMLAAMMAREIGADVNVALRAGLLHDIGKAVDRDVEGTHTELSVEMTKKYGETEKVVQAIASHHRDVDFPSIEAVLVQAADTLSAARPGARRELLETYIQRLEKLEEIATSFEGVSKAFALQAGREIRIIVESQKVSDDRAALAAKEIAARIKNELDYPGQIKVTVIREMRAVEYAR